ncbi:MAG: membrane protein insertion efficiency factor YidD [Chloroflexi bacterium]|nr:membrane protein insertion efficiency factor YidD [Chloroflexota bacterium]MCH7983984.1 membrane protein insertion efficiency factor YidD [Chloroflexota bacterium]MCH8115545.1 membrane protein insertion efficiency factor YidD [Chloroflexota bacterium]MCH8230700.1 membrane protein insertion efficiency factor YidD [Chloroflexota bacterium]MCH8909492.1 membrane protein insertion efficiency factor YidD [Chloroflexota bacterium]
MSKFFLLLIKGYKLSISPYWPGQCRYDPTCSEFAAEAIQAHGAFTGSWLAIRRIGRCHPGRSRGYDPVPTKKT